MNILPSLQTHMRRNRWGGVIRTTLIVVPILIVSLSILAVFARNRVLLATNNLTRVVINLSEKPLSTITSDDIEELDTTLEDVTSTLSTSRLLTYPVRPIAWFVPRWWATMQQLDITYELSLAAQDMLDGTQPALTLVIDDPSSELATGITSGARLTDLLAYGRINFDVADEHLAQADRLLNHVHLERLSNQQIIDFHTIGAVQDQLQTLNTALSVSPQLINMLAGVDDETNYLILAQNNDEIRPSGGFIGSYGWMRVSNGRVIAFNYWASDDNNPSQPPDSFNETFTIPDWWIRFRNPIYAAWDGSWYADFSDTAELAMRYYDAGDNLGAPIDAVVAIDITGFEILLSALGEVVVEDYDTTITAENFREAVYDIRSLGYSVDAHKVFLGEVYRAIQQQWADIPLETLPGVGEAMLTGLEQKHIMLYFNDADAQHAIDTLGWGGDVRSSNGSDYLLVNDANISGNKSNNSIQRNLTLDVTLLETGDAQQSLAIQYDYLDSIANDDPAVDPQFHGPLVYVNRLQVFTPLSATITESDFPLLRSFNYNDLGQHIASLQVNYDSTERYEIHYTSTDVVEQAGSLHHYRLYLDQQAGARPQRVDIRVILPNDSEVIHTIPETDSVYESPQVAVDFLLEQTTSQWVEIIYRVP